MVGSRARRHLWTSSCMSRPSRWCELTRVISLQGFDNPELQAWLASGPFGHRRVSDDHHCCWTMGQTNCHRHFFQVPCIARETFFLALALRSWTLKCVISACECSGFGVCFVSVPGEKLGLDRWIRASTKNPTFSVDGSDQRSSCPFARPRFQSRVCWQLKVLPV